VLIEGEGCDELLQLNVSLGKIDFSLSSNVWCLVKGPVNSHKYSFNFFMVLNRPKYFSLRHFNPKKSIKRL
jgi:hypothetical protein